MDGPRETGERVRVCLCVSCVCTDTSTLHSINIPDNAWGWNAPAPLMSLSGWRPSDRWLLRLVGSVDGLVSLSVGSCEVGMPGMREVVGFSSWCMSQGSGLKAQGLQVNCTVPVNTEHLGTYGSLPPPLPEPPTPPTATSHLQSVLSSITHHSVLARCRVLLSCASTQIAPVFHTSTSHVRGQGPGLFAHR